MFAILRNGVFGAKFFDEFEREMEIFDGFESILTVIFFSKIETPKSIIPLEEASKKLTFLRFHKSANILYHPLSFQKLTFLSFQKTDI